MVLLKTANEVDILIVVLIIAATCLLYIGVLIKNKKTSGFFEKIKDLIEKILESF